MIALSIRYEPERLAALPLSPPPRDPRFAPSPVEICQLASEWRPGDVGPGWIVEEKVDGIRALWLGDRLVTREGNPIECADHLLPDLQRLQRRFGRPMFLDGEYVEPGGFVDTIRALRGNGRQGGAGTLHLFDALPLDEWREDACTRPLTARKAMLRDAMSNWGPEGLRIVPQTPVASRGDVERMAGDVWARGGEGLMLKRADALYARRRSDAWRKVKRKLQLTGRMVEVLHDGAAAVVEVDGVRVRVAVGMSMRCRLPAVEMDVAVEAMEWTPALRLRQGVIVEMNDGA